MVATDRVRAPFADARDLHADALEMLAQGRIRNAAEKASSTGLRMLESLDPEVRSARLVRRYYTRQGHLHGGCFYAGLCEPIDERLSGGYGRQPPTLMTPSAWLLSELQQWGVLYQ